MNNTLLFSRTGGIVTNDHAVLPLVALMERYLAEKSSGERETWRATGTALRLFVEHIKRNRKPERLPLAEFTRESVEGYVQVRLVIGDAPTTVATRLSLIKAFGRWLEDRLPQYVSPARSVKTPVIEKKEWAGVTEDDWRAMEEVAPTVGSTAFLRQRNGLWVSMYFRTGLRAAEVLRLTEDQLTPERDAFLNVWCKGKKFRRVAVSPALRALLDAWMPVRKAFYNRINITDTGPYPILMSAYRAIKSHPDSFRLSYSTAHQLISEVAERGCGRHVNVHKTRHTFGRRVYAATKDIMATAVALGHSDVKTTMRYTTPPQEVVDAAVAEAFE